ncbi:type II secretion system protein GspL [Kistimonas asteriae]|uniref:type II secretion system protein GspL n=1 Tax=Kistimonas asteriae TaxID=517724 RepID=UPI001BA66816|nr:type II secretion system protein GspL [Kistimonas asteriae]
MNQELVIRIMPSVHGEGATSPVQWMVRGQASDDEATIRQGSLPDLQVWAEQVQQEVPEQWPEQITVLLPGTLTGLQRLPVTSAQKKHLQQALPYLVEENLIGNVEEQHIVGLPEAGHDSVLVGHLPVADMQELMDTFAESGIAPVSVVSENGLWHTDEKTIMLLFEQGMVTIASHEKPAQTVDRDALSLLLGQYLHHDVVKQGAAVQVDDDKDTSEPENVITTIKVLSEHNESDTDIALITGLAGDGVTIEHQGVNGGSVLSALASLLSEQRRARALVEFRSGAFKCPRKAGKRWRQWRPVAWVAGVWLALEFVFYVGQGVWFQSQAAHYYAQNYALYKEINPGDRSVVDVRNRFNSLLKRAGTAQADNGFLLVLNTLSRVSAQASAKGVEPKSLDFNESGDGVTLNVAAASFEAVNRYLEALREAGLKATMETANQEGDTVVARLSMKSS